jgi:hypothetical protein
MIYIFIPYRAFQNNNIIIQMYGFHLNVFDLYDIYILYH